MLGDFLFSFTKIFFAKGIFCVCGGGADAASKAGKPIVKTTAKRNGVDLVRFDDQIDLGLCEAGPDEQLFELLRRTPDQKGPVDDPAHHIRPW
ncbi:MAG: hypothetical protein COV59_01440 [Candidatus Magasanikbacteria bacterium CG11_big_fil_rev_8_21_14_0_20_39_34]|uniref:Uncharacterized protein n=1 Tax=Candidatus Magasanikbacteria bacterium CG11_big_fil_rev_8_21_14_0_20_39_34 TaxID=1974653 RepID=A0A2H0N5V8_9BACT|nr:MAG: hypothetical protein COV59_01440 [Candidatus Magasanikbacteria bacterium CG11_big_fil_rev_8_21_14_0_20_39_34]